MVSNIRFRPLFELDKERKAESGEVTYLRRLIEFSVLLLIEIGYSHMGASFYHYFSFALWGIEGQLFFSWVADVLLEHIF